MRQPSGDEREALARTVQLIADDVYGVGLGEDEELETGIVEGLQSTTVKIVSDEANARSHSGQTAIVTLAGLVAMMGIDLVVDVPDVALLTPQPPLREARLLSGLLEYGADLVPGMGFTQERRGADLTIAIGSTPTRSDGAFLRLSGAAWSCRVAADARGPRWSDDWPIGALAGAGAASADAFRVALRNIAQVTRRPLPARPGLLLDVNRHVEVDLALDGLSVDRADLGEVDFVSGGAITTAAMFCLMRLPNLSIDCRVFEPERLDLSNLNRYGLARRSNCGCLKIAMLAGAAHDGVLVRGIDERFGPATVDRHGPLSQRVLVGVDDIPSRWEVQRQAPGWVCVGATSHLWHAMVTTHNPGEPCAGCVHPRDDGIEAPIPTISFVSFWAGLMQVRALLAEAHGVGTGYPQVLISPSGLYGPRGIHGLGVAPNRDCPVGCAASRQAA